MLCGVDVCLSEALFAQRYGASEEGEAADLQRTKTGGGRRGASRAAPALYAHRDGLFSLCEREPAWNDLETPDGTGFRAHFDRSGARVVRPALLRRGLLGQHDAGRPHLLLVPQNSDVVCFESAADDEHGAPRRSSRRAQATSLRTRSSDSRRGQPRAVGGARGRLPQPAPARRHRHLPAPRAGISSNDSGGSKMCGTSVALTYNNRESFLHGLDDLIAMPALTMEGEFLRDGPSSTWKDWKGVTYTSRREWEYVNGPAKRKEGCTPGTRDAENDGKTPQQFLELMNAFIRQRREQGHGTMLDDAHAYLSLDEVLAVRLYSGPAYQPINTFLRQISSLNSTFRATVSQHPSLTFAATVGHICRAIRKLAAVANDEEANAGLWRGVRGELDKAFWFPDAQGMVCAVDMAFMSTSRSRQPPIDYMDGSGPNVLWQLYPKPESDSGFHRGASIELLSQFAGEKEVLFACDAGREGGREDSRRQARGRCGAGQAARKREGEASALRILRGEGGDGERQGLPLCRCAANLFMTPRADVQCRRRG